ncbi:MAG TPA: sugar phosphate isomerase/epimerase [Bryobacteraceae bacterium]|nr:sugar phosphate isomerase/epimerase [Bryobacteraceae bacterium]
MRTTRREFVSAGAALALAAQWSRAADKANKIPIGLELYSVRHELEKDLPGTLDHVAQMGYDCVEFYSTYEKWTPEQARTVREQLDKLKLKCYSTHNGMESFSGDGLTKAIELNKILGTKYIVLAHPGGNIKTLDQWNKVAATLDAANEQMKSSGLHAGYHNHDLEWKPVDGKRPLEVLAENTDKSIMLQLDVGTCLEAGGDPVAWINTHPGRIKSLHVKDWSPKSGYQVLFGEGVAPWKEIFAAAEKRGGVEYYLIEQEGSRFPELETAERCLVAYKDLRSGKNNS